MTNKLNQLFDLSQKGKAWSLFILLGILVCAIISIAIDVIFFNGTTTVVGHLMNIVDHIYPYWLVVAGGVAVTGVTRNVVEGISNIKNNSSYADRDDIN